jgi:hypothetical protein
MLKWIKILLGFDKPVVVWEKFYNTMYVDQYVTFRYTIYHYPLSNSYRLEMDPWKIKPLYTPFKANAQPMYIEAMKKLRELENDKQHLAH